MFKTLAGPFEFLAKVIKSHCGGSEEPQTPDLSDKIPLK